MWFIMLPISALVAVTAGLPCDEAQLKCVYREGCGQALNNYMVGCSAILQGSTDRYCPEICLQSLISLVSTPEGKAMMNCHCNDSYCENQKKRPQVCRAEVTRILDTPVIPCRMAQWICSADTQCSTAFEYYHRYCKSMFHGKKCTPKCLNSISILLRQEKAKQLKMCKCEGDEEYNCSAIQRNMNKLCFRHKYNVTRVKAPVDKVVPEPPKVVTTDITPHVIQVNDNPGSSCDSASIALSVAVLTSILPMWIR